MDNFSTLFLQGMITAGIPTGTLVAIAWLILKNSPKKAIGSFFLLVLIGGLFGYLGCVPISLVSIWFALKNTKLQKAMEVQSDQGDRAGDLLTKLFELHSQGALSREEFEIEKRKILEKIA
jgi:uncharacterized membrane protein